MVTVTWQVIFGVLGTLGHFEIRLSFRRMTGILAGTLRMSTSYPNEVLTVDAAGHTLEKSLSKGPSNLDIVNP